MKNPRLLLGMPHRETLYVSGGTTQPSLPMVRGRAQTMTHDYRRHGTTDLFAALNLDPPMRSLGVTVSASLGSFVALCLGWVCRIRRCARLYHCGFLVVPVLGGWSARGEGGWAERCGVERVELVLPGPAGG